MPVEQWRERVPAFSESILGKVFRQEATEIALPDELSQITYRPGSSARTRLNIAGRTPAMFKRIP